MRTKPAGRADGLIWIWLLWGTIILAILAILLIDLFNEGESTGPEDEVIVSDITDDLQEYHGSTVTVSGEIQELVGPRAFAIVAQDDLGSGTLLVVGGQRLPQMIEVEVNEINAGDVVQVTGLVRELDTAELEEGIGADLDDALFAGFEGEPVVIANTVVVTAKASDASEQNAQAALDTLAYDPVKAT